MVNADTDDEVMTPSKAPRSDLRSNDVVFSDVLFCVLTVCVFITKSIHRIDYSMLAKTSGTCQSKRLKFNRADKRFTTSNPLSGNIGKYLKK